MFISDLFMGSISSKDMTLKSRLLQLLKDVPDSLVMARFDPNKSDLNSDCFHMDTFGWTFSNVEKWHS